MRKIIIAAVFALIASPIAAEPLILHVASVPAQKLALNVQARRGFHIPPLPAPLHFPGDNPTPAPVVPTQDPVTAILTAVAEVKADIISDLTVAGTMASTPIPNQVPSLCEAPATFNNGSPGTPAVTSFQGNISIAGTTLTVNSVTQGALQVGSPISDATGLVAAGTVITEEVLGAAGAITYIVNNSQTVANDAAQVVVTPAVPASPASCSTPEIWDQLGAACFPAMVTFVNQLPGPGTIPTIPPNSGGGLVSSAEEVRLIDLAAKSFIANIKTVGYPTSLKIACDPWFLDYVTQANLDLAQIVKAAGGVAVGAALPGSNLLSGLLLQFIPAKTAQAHGLPVQASPLGRLRH